MRVSVATKQKLQGLKQSNESDDSALSRILSELETYNL